MAFANCGSSSSISTCRANTILRAKSFSVRSGSSPKIGGLRHIGWSNKTPGWARSTTKRWFEPQIRRQALPPKRRRLPRRSTLKSPLLRQTLPLLPAQQHLLRQRRALRLHHTPQAAALSQPPLEHFNQEIVFLLILFCGSFGESVKEGRWQACVKIAPASGIAGLATGAGPLTAWAVSLICHL